MLRICLCALVLLAHSPAHADLKGFLATARPSTGQQQYFAGLRVARPVGTLLRRIGLGRWLHRRQVVQVTNQTLQSFTRTTARGYLEVVIPADKGHVFFRHGDKVYDFYQGGFRVGPVRPVGSERYGMLVRLSPSQETRLVAYFDRLERTGGKELGSYDFSGRKGFHCVSWLMRQPLDSRGANLVQLLGGKRAGGMPSFSRFLLKRARGVEAVVVYDRDARSANQLSRMGFKLMSDRQIVDAFREQRRQARAADQ